MAKNASRRQRADLAQRAEAKKAFVDSPRTLPNPLHGMKWLGPQLVNAQNEAEFLRHYFATGEEQGESAKSLASRAGYNSSGPISECLNGKRAMSEKFVEKIAMELLVPDGFRRLFIALAKALRPQDFKGVSHERAKAEYLKLRSRLREDLTQKIDDELSSTAQLQIVGSIELFVTFSALEPNRGLSLQEIVDRAVLPIEIVKRQLKILEEARLIYEFGDKYFSQRERVDLLNEAYSQSFQKCFERALELLKERAQRLPDHPKDLYFHSTILTDDQSLRTLQSALQTSTIDLLDRHCADTGDQVAHVLLSVFRRKVS